MIKKIKFPVLKPSHLFYGLLLLCLFCVTACGERGASEEPSPGPSKLKVVGYLFSHSDKWLAGFDTLALEGVTDLNLAFVDPETDGSFLENAELKTLVDKAHARKMTVYFSIGGGDPPAHLEALIKPGQREAFAQSIVDFAVSHRLDGVDIDLENDLINDDYAPFVAAVSARMKSAGKKITAALASWNANKIHDSTLARYDHIHIMSYDKTGPWNPAQAGPHSPFSMAVDDLQYFSTTRGVELKKLSIGLPFYGYGFGNGAPSSISFRDIALQYPQSVNLDEITLSSGGKIYYNGKTTIRQKVTMAVERGAGGVMIWQLAGDAKTPHSLLTQIREVKGER